VGFSSALLAKPAKTKIPLIGLKFLFSSAVCAFIAFTFYLFSIPLTQILTLEPELRWEWNVSAIHLVGLFETEN